MDTPTAGTSFLSRGLPADDGGTPHKSKGEKARAKENDAAWD